MLTFHSHLNSLTLQAAKFQVKGKASNLNTEDVITCCLVRVIVHLRGGDSWLWNSDAWWLEGKNKRSRKKPTLVHIIHHYLTRSHPGLNPRLCSEKSVSVQQPELCFLPNRGHGNQHRHGTAVILMGLSHYREPVLVAFGGPQLTVWPLYCHTVFINIPCLHCQIIFCCFWCCMAILNGKCTDIQHIITKMQMSWEEMTNYS
jgi:hypothetical protein